MKTNLKVLAGFAVLALLLRWLFPAQIPDLPKPLPSQTLAESRPELRTNRPAPPIKRVVPTPEAMEEVTAAVAEEAGLGWIRCEVGPDFPAGGAIGAFENAEVRDGVLVATVRTPSGHTAVRNPLTAEERKGPESAIRAQFQRDHNPMLTLRWSGANQGQRGVCEVMQKEKITLSGVVRDADGTKVSVGVVRGCGPATMHEDGSWETEWWSNTPCTLFARNSRGTREGLGPPLDLFPTADMAGIELLAPEELEPRWMVLERQTLEAADELAAMEGEDDALDRAWKRDDLTPEARELLERWLEVRDRRKARLQKRADRVVNKPEPGEVWEDPDW